MDGLLVIDKPVGPTSHDVVARVRRILRERRVGHTGTLDPLASGVLLLLIGRATRLAQFLHGDDKRYDATIRLGFSTDTYDALGQPTSAPHQGPWPSRDEIERALEAFRGSFAQQPPAFSAKKIEGRRSYRLARAQRGAAHDQPVAPPPVNVTVSSLTVLDVEKDSVRIAVACSTGFYVRSLAHDLGTALGTGAHLIALRRIAAGGRTLGEAVPLAELEDGAAGLERARNALIPLSDVLPGLPRLTLTARGVRRAASGCSIGSDDCVDASQRRLYGALPEEVRLLDAAQNLVGIARATPAGLLRPVVVLM